MGDIKVENEKVSFEEKISILEEFYKTGENLNGKTVYKGYPIGKWAIQCRSWILGCKIKFSEQQYERLEKIGVLERKIDCHLDEKIDRLINFKKKYPDISVNSVKIPETNLRKYTKTEEEFESLREEYKRIQEYYDYVKERKRQGKLTEEQFRKCKQGKIGGIFKYSPEVEEIIEKYEQNPTDVHYILENFESIENFLNAFQKGKLKEKDIILAQTILNGEFDIDFDPQSRRYDVLFNAIRGKPKVDKKLRFYSSKAINEILEDLIPNEKIVLEKHFGLRDGKSSSFGIIAKELGISRNRAYQIERNALRLLRNSMYISKISCEKPELTTEEETGLTPEEREKYLDLRKNLFINYRFKPQGEEKESCKKKNLEYLNLIKKVKEKNKKEEDFLSKSIEQIGLEERTVRLLKRRGYNTVEDVYKGRKQIKNIRGFGEKAFSDVYEAFYLKGINLNDKAESNLETLKKAKEKLENRRNAAKYLAEYYREHGKVKGEKDK